MNEKQLQQLKDYIDTLAKLPKQQTCPNCGYCPHCGRHYYYPQPYYWWYGPVTSDSLEQEPSSITITCNGIK